jgi:hypothetical protein
MMTEISLHPSGRYPIHPVIATPISHNSFFHDTSPTATATATASSPMIIATTTATTSPISSPVMEATAIFMDDAEEEEYNQSGYDVNSVHSMVTISGDIGSSESVNIVGSGGGGGVNSGVNSNSGGGDRDAISESGDVHGVMQEDIRENNDEEVVVVGSSSRVNNNNHNSTSISGGHSVQLQGGGNGGGSERRVELANGRRRSGHDIELQRRDSRTRT